MTPLTGRKSINSSFFFSFFCMVRRLLPSQQSEADVGRGDRGGPHRWIKSKKGGEGRRKERKDVVWVTEKGWREKR